MSITLRRAILAAGALACLTGFASAQTTTTTETKKFEVIAVDGNQLVVKLPEGTREITVPPGFVFTVDGKQLSVGELKPGMAGTATITKTTTSTPVTVTEVRNGTVVQANPVGIIVRTAEGYKSFTQSDIDKRGVKIMRGGKPATIADFHAGDKLSAVIITEKPPKVVTEQEVKATLAASGAGAAAAPPAASASTGAAAGEPTTLPARAPSASGRKLPKTASPLPLYGLFGGLSLLAGAGLSMRRLFSR
jgi:hypothetical protein